MIPRMYTPMDVAKRFARLGPLTYFWRSNSKGYVVRGAPGNAVTLPTATGNQEPGLSRIFIDKPCICYGFCGQFQARLNSAAETAVFNVNQALFRAAGPPHFHPLAGGIVSPNAQGKFSKVASADNGWTTQWCMHNPSQAPFAITDPGHYWIVTDYEVTVQALTGGAMYRVDLDCPEAVIEIAGFPRDLSLASAAFVSGDMSGIVPSGFPTGFTGRAASNHIANIDWGLLIREIL